MTKIEITSEAIWQKVEIGGKYLQASVVSMWTLQQKDVFTCYQSVGNTQIQFMLKEVTRVDESTYNHRTLTIEEVTKNKQIQNALIEHKYSFKL